jgi:RNA polymerase sigma-B factor
LAAQGAGRTRSLDEPDLNGDGSGDRRWFSSALGLHEAEFDLIEDRQTLAPLLAALPERERWILSLRFFDGLTQAEIGALVGISQMHVSRLLTRTLTRLRRQLLADGPAEGTMTDGRARAPAAVPDGPAPMHRRWPGTGSESG